MAGGTIQTETEWVDIAADEEAGRFAPLYCPHCGCRGRIRSSKPVTGQHRIMHYQCINLFCSHTWRASLSYEYGLVASGIPNPKVDLPLRPVSRQDVLEAMRPRDTTQPDMFDGGAGASPPAASAA